MAPSATTTIALASSDSFELHVPLVGSAVSALNSSSRSPLHRFAHVSDSQTGRKRALLLSTTESGMLAALEPRNGSVGIIVSHGQARVDSVDAYFGRTIWTHQALSTSGQIQTLCWTEGTNTHDVIVATDKAVERLSGQSGQVIWTINVESTTLPMLTQIDSNTVLVVTSDDTTSQAVDASTGKLIEDQSRFTAIDAKASANTITSLVRPKIDSVRVTLWVKAGRIHYVNEAELSGKTRSVKQWKDKESDSPVMSFRDVGVVSHGVILAVRQDETCVALVATEQGHVEMLWDFADANSASLLSAFADRNGGLHIAHLTFSEFFELGTLQVVEFSNELNEDGGILSGHTFGYDDSRDGPFNAFALEVAPLEKGIATRTFIGSKGGSMQAWEQDTLVWTRNESLTSPDVIVWQEKRIALVDEQRQTTKGLTTQGVSETLQKLMDAFAHRKLNSNVRGRLIVGSSKHRSIIVADVDKNFTVTGRYYLPEDLGLINFARITSSDADSTKAEVVVAKDDGDVVSLVLDMTEGTWSSSAPSTELIVRHSTDKDGVTTLSGSDSGAVHWQFKLPKRHHVLTRTTCHIGAVASSGKVLGDRSTLRKLLNPHAVAFVIVNTNESDSNVEASGSIVIVDSRGGSILATIDDIEGLQEASRAHVAFVDNWLLLSYYAKGDSTVTTRVVSFELFDIKGTVQVASRSFVVPDTINVKSITSSSLGIASKAAIFTNELGQLVAIPQRLLNARRPFGKPTKHDMEEMLIPYDRFLRFNDEAVMFSQAEVLDTIKVKSFPSHHRESETILFTFGLDLLMGSTCSSLKPFDELSSQFNKLQLIVALSLLTFGFLWTRRAVKQDRNKRKWYQTT
ncbi:hypothetical protein OIO90_004355 [Microbotryomycetes sp. JL221]|nr:hypothetical protein OIO90_004355 [Microbotryomycetes sp. JL221]